MNGRRKRYMAEFESAVPIRVYRSHYRKTLIVMAGFLALFGVLGSGYLAYYPLRYSSTEPESAVIWCVALPFIMLVLSLTAGVLYIANCTRIITSPEGIEYHELAHSVTTTWDNVQRIGIVPGLGAAEGLLLRRPALQVRKGMAWAVKEQVHGRIIPLTPFGLFWRESDLGEDIKRYAPHVFERESL
jgi:hypothetical protein